MKKKESVKNKKTKQMTIEEREKERKEITKLLNVKKATQRKEKKVVEFCFEIVLGFSVCLCLVFLFCFVFTFLVAGGRGNGSRSNCWRN